MSLTLPGSKTHHPYRQFEYKVSHDQVRPHSSRAQQDQAAFLQQATVDRSRSYQRTIHHKSTAERAAFEKCTSRHEFAVWNSRCQSGRLSPLRCSSRAPWLEAGIPFLGLLGPALPSAFSPLPRLPTNYYFPPACCSVTSLFLAIGNCG